MDAEVGLQHWLDGIALSLAPTERRRLLRKLAIGLKQRTASRIRSQRDPDSYRFAPRLRDQHGRIRSQQPMFTKLAKRLKLRVTDTEAAIGFGGRDGRIARIHHYGLMDKPTSRARPVRYAVRELVGFASDDQRWIQTQILEFLSQPT